MESRVIMNEVRSSADLAIVNECRLPTAGAIECYPSPCVRRYAFVGL